MVETVSCSGWGVWLDASSWTSCGKDYSLASGRTDRLRCKTIGVENKAPFNYFLL